MNEIKILEAKVFTRKDTSTVIHHVEKASDLRTFIDHAKAHLSTMQPLEVIEVWVHRADRSKERLLELYQDQQASEAASAASTEADPFGWNYGR